MTATTAPASWLQSTIAEPPVAEQEHCDAHYNLPRRPREFNMGPVATHTYSVSIIADWYNDEPKKERSVERKRDATQIERR